MLEKLVGKRVSVAVAFVTASKMNYANIKSKVYAIFVLRFLRGDS